MDKKPRPKPDPWESFKGIPEKLTKLLDSESDRGVILIVAAYLDELLGLIIRSATVSDSLGAGLLDHRHPAGDFSGRISLCEAFGLIHEQEARALNLVRKIRNSAAHFDGKGRGFDVLFDSPGTSDQVNELSQAMNLGSIKGASADRDYFILLARLLATRLYARGTMNQRIAAPQTIKEIAAIHRAKHLNGPNSQFAKTLDQIIENSDIDGLIAWNDAVREALEAAIREQRSAIQTPDLQG